MDISVTKTGSNCWAGRSYRCHQKGVVTKSSAPRLRSNFSRAAPEGVFVVSEPQFNLAEDTYVVPDVLVHPFDIKTPDVRGVDALLVVEIADTSLAYDLRTKARLCASHGVREYWVINAATLVTTVHTQPSGTEYAMIREAAGSAQISPALVPALAVSLATLDLD
jgi:Uma2 family endonuclease